MSMYHVEIDLWGCNDKRHRIYTINDADTMVLEGDQGNEGLSFHKDGKLIAVFSDFRAAWKDGAITDMQEVGTFDEDNDDAAAEAA